MLYIVDGSVKDYKRFCLQAAIPYWLVTRRLSADRHRLENL